MDSTVPERVKGALVASGRPLTSSEIGARLRLPPPEVELALETLRHDAQLVVREWPMEDPHFGVDRIVVACRVDPAGDAAATSAAEAASQQVYDNILRDFLASHRCV
jgi:hypothetical protein